MKLTQKVVANLNLAMRRDCGSESHWSFL